MTVFPAGSAKEASAWQQKMVCRGSPTSRFFRTTETPVYFVSATAFNLLGTDRWLPSFRYINYYDSFDGPVGAGLGTDLVVQTPYGDSGETTHFIASEEDWNEVADELAEEALKVMRRIEPREAAIEGVVTRHGTLVGPLMTELTGFPELTPYGGGWCGNDIHPEALTPTHRTQARTWIRALGERLRREGYRGYFELDYLVDSETGDVSGRAEPPRYRRQLPDERERRRLRRHAACSSSWTSTTRSTATT